MLGRRRTRGGRHAPAARRGRVRRGHPWRRAVAAVVVAGVVAVAATGVAASRVTGNEPLSAKWADWLRGHHMAALAATLEQVYYDHSAPAKGGRPKQLNPVPAADARTATAARRTGSAPAHLAPPTPVPLIVQPAVPGEGQWTPMGDLVGGRPAMYEAQFRADDQYTSQITSAVWIDPTLARLSLVPGATEPGGTWPEPPDLTGSAAAHALAAFNGGFRFQDAHGGFFLDGRTAVPLQAGAASLVISRDGRVDVGRWGSQVTMTPSVTAVLQNLVPIVDDGRPAPDATYADSRIWGRTLHSSTIVARSGVGVTADGAVVYVAGPALSARTLAESLARVGAVRAMSLDINPEWVTFNVYRHDPATGAIAAAKLYPQMNRPATRYLGPTRESRDFFVVSAPGGP